MEILKHQLVIERNGFAVFKFEDLCRIVGISRSPWTNPQIFAAEPVENDPLWRDWLPLGDEALVYLSPVELPEPEAIALLDRLSLEACRFRDAIEPGGMGTVMEYAERGARLAIREHCRHVGFNPTTARSLEALVPIAVEHGVRAAKGHQLGVWDMLSACAAVLGPGHALLSIGRPGQELLRDLLYRSTQAAEACARELVQARGGKE